MSATQKELDVMRLMRHEETYKEVGREILDALSPEVEEDWWPDAATPEDIARLFPDHEDKRQ